MSAAYIHHMFVAGSPTKGKVLISVSDKANIEQLAKVRAWLFQLDTSVANELATVQAGH